MSAPLTPSTLALDAPSAQSEDAIMPTENRHQARKRSVGDASQLFGGGGSASGLDDFFGNSSSFPSQVTSFATLQEEPETLQASNISDDFYSNHSIINSDPYTLTHQPHFLPHSYDASLSYNSPHLTQSAPETFAQYSPASYSDSNTYEPVPQTISHYADYPSYDAFTEQHYTQDPNPLSQTGLGISHGPPQQSVHNHQTSQPDYNPYGRSQSFVSSSPHPAPSQTSSNNPYEPFSNVLGHVPRAASVGYQPVPPVPLGPNHSAAPPSLTRPKGFDAYDPPPIRKKKHVPPSAAASLPSSPALGFGQAAHFAPPPASHILPPPPKKRSISGPAQTPLVNATESYQPEQQSYTYAPEASQRSVHDPIFQSSPGPQQAQSLHAPNLHWSSVNPDAQTQSAHQLVGDSPYEHQRPDSFGFQTQGFDPYNPTPSFQPSTTSYHNSSGNIPPTTTVYKEDPYAMVNYRNESYQTPINQPDDQKFRDPYGPPNTLQADSRRSSSGTIPRINDGRESPLSPDHARSPTFSPPVSSPHQPPDPSVPTIMTSPKLGHGPPSPTGSNSLGNPFDRKPKRSSPLKMAVSVDEEPEGLEKDLKGEGGDNKAVEDSGSPSTESQTIDDLLVQATQNLSLTSLASDQHSSDKGTYPAATFPPAELGTLDLVPDHLNDSVPRDPAGVSTNNFMAVPAVLVQPASPEISITDVPEPPSTNTSFDILADLDQGVAPTRPSEDLIHDSSPYGYAPPNGAGTTQDCKPYAPEYAYHQNLNQGQLEDSEIPMDVNDYQSMSTPEAKHFSTFSDTYTPQANKESNVYGRGTQDYFSQQGALGAEKKFYDPYAYQTTGNPAPYEPILSEPSSAPISSISRPSSRNILTDPPTHHHFQPDHDIYASHTRDHPSDRDTDPILQRRKCRIPLASFGFGGKLVTVFPSGGQGTGFVPTTGYENPYGTVATAASGTTVQIHKLSDVIPFSELQAFPGPLFMEGGSKSSIGKKRKDVVQWLEAKIGESEKEFSYIQSNGYVNKNSPVNQDIAVGGAQTVKIEQVQDKHLVLCLLKILVENEGKLCGSPKIDESVRSALQSVKTRSPSESTSSVTHPIDALAAGRGFASTMPSSPSPETIASYTVRSSSLDALQTLLSHGDRLNALKFTLDQKMWAHALVIANSLGNETWRETVREFGRYELSSQGGPGSGGFSPNGRESLRTLYSLFAGAGPSAIEEFIPPTLLSGPFFTTTEFSSSLAPNPYPINGTPSAANSRTSSPAPAIAKPELRHHQGGAKVSNEVLDQWRPTVAMSIANRVPGTAAFLVSLGDTLLSNGRVHAAHACYLLSNGLSPILSLEHGARICLLGSDLKTPKAGPGLDVEAVMLTEVLEFALSLAVVNKGLEAFMGIPHLQNFKLAMGYEYATAGLVTTAHKYCEAIGATLKLTAKPGNLYHPTLAEQVKAFSGRLSAAPVPPDKATSWIARKMPRPTLDNVWQSLEGRVHKFVAGDEDEGKLDSSAGGNGNGCGGAILSTSHSKALGPFSHYSSISPGSSTGSLSRAHSSTDLKLANQQPTLAGGPFSHGTLLQRPASGGGFSSTPMPLDRDPRQRSTSAMVPGPTFSSWYSHADQAFHAPTQPFLADIHSDLPSDSTSTAATVVTANGGGGGGWWDAASGGGKSAIESAPATFEGASTFDDTAEFIDPMASFGMPAFSSATSTADFTTYRNHDSSKDDDDDEDDLGLGNNTGRKKERGDDDDDEDGDGKKSGGAVETTPKLASASFKAEDKTLKPTPSSSWLGRWFKRDASQASGSGPIKANLGEEVSLVYDPETKRWVNRKPGGTSGSPAPSTPPPPPARAQTASPTSAMRSLAGPPSSSPINSLPPPPPISRSMSSTTPSIIAKSENRLSQPTTLRNSISAADICPSPELLPPLSMSNAPPPSTASKKPGTKKNLRSRYVEIR